MSYPRAIPNIEVLTRSVLLTLGLDPALIDFLACTAIGATAILLTLLFLGGRTTRSVHRCPKN